MLILGVMALFFPLNMPPDTLTMLAIVAETLYT